MQHLTVERYAAVIAKVESPRPVHFTYLRIGIQTSGDAFQQLLATAAGGPVRELWDVRGKVVPSSLLLDGVNISVLEKVDP